MRAALEAGPAGFAGEIITPDSADYGAASRNALTAGAPALILRPADTADVQRAVRWAGGSGLPLATRGGGHSAAGLSTIDGGVIIDLRDLNTVSVGSDDRVRVGGGALWRQVVEALGPHDLVISSGDTADVGVGGLTLSGGIGWLVRAYGLTLDHLRSVEIVTASGEMLVADDTQHAELFWALRGGGGAYGVVTAFEFQAQRIADVAYAALTFPAEEAAGIVTAWTAYMRTAPHGISSTLVLADQLAGSREAPVEVTLVRSDGHDLDGAVAALSGAGTVLSADVRRRPYADVLHAGAELPAGLRASVRNGFIPADAVEEAALTVARLASEEQPSTIIMHSLGGAFSEVMSDATAFDHRSAEIMVTTFAVSPDAAVDGTRARLDALWGELSPYVEGVYANSLDGSSADAVSAIFSRDTLTRLATVKDAYDPNDLFSRNFGPRARVTR